MATCEVTSDNLPTIKGWLELSEPHGYDLPLYIHDLKDDQDWFNACAQCSTPKRHNSLVDTPPENESSKENKTTPTQSTQSKRDERIELRIPWKQEEWKDNLRIISKLGLTPVDTLCNLVYLPYGWTIYRVNDQIALIDAKGVSRARFDTMTRVLYEL